MALIRKRSTEPAAALRAVAPAETATSRSSWTSRVGALSALARLPAFRQGVRFFLTAALVGAMNATVGVAVGAGSRLLIRKIRGKPGAAPPSAT